MNYSERSFGKEFYAGQTVSEEAVAWASFAAARLASEFCQSWLTLQCRLVRGTLGLLLLEDDDGSFAPAATWPAGGTAAAELVPAAERALRERRGVVARTEAGSAHAAYPVDIGGRLWGVVVVDLGPYEGGFLQDALRRLHWGAGWLETLFHRRQAQQDIQKLAATRLALEMAAVAGSATGLLSAATALTSELAIRLDCRRVAIGTVRHGRAQVLALSHAASVANELRLADSLANAMEEAVDQSASVGLITAWLPAAAAVPAVPCLGARCRKGKYVPEASSGEATGGGRPANWGALLRREPPPLARVRCPATRPAMAR
jgi:hypothetical protein